MVSAATPYAAGSVARAVKQSLVQSSTVRAGQVFLDHVVDEFCRYLTETDLADIGSDTLTSLLQAQLRSAHQRQVPETVVECRMIPGADGADSDVPRAVVHIATTDRPFLVDSVTMSITSQGWNIRHIMHPQVEVRRDPEGNLIEGSIDGVPSITESWITVVITQGSSPEATLENVEHTLVDNLAMGAIAATDQGRMTHRLMQQIDALAIAPQLADTSYARAVLPWLAKGHFILLGYREYTFDTDFHPVDGTALGILRHQDDAGTFHAYPDATPSLLVVTKDPHMSPVHRHTYLDYVGVRQFSADGVVVGEARFLGLFAASAYMESVFAIPGLRVKAQQLRERSGYSADSHDDSRLLQTIATYPRDELFQASVDELLPIVKSAASLLEKRQVRAFFRPSVYGHFVSVTIYMPRDRYSTSIRAEIQQILLDAVGGISVDHQAHVSESVIARLFFVIRVPSTERADHVDPSMIEGRIWQVCLSWDDRFTAAARQAGIRAGRVRFSPGYQSDYSPQQAVTDSLHVSQLTDENDLRCSIQRSQDVGDVRLKVACYQSLSLAHAMPHLARLGVTVVDERPYDVTLDRREAKIYDFGLDLPSGVGGDVSTWVTTESQRFVDAFVASYRGITESDDLNGLVVVAGLTWRQVSWLRIVSRYLRQVPIAYSQGYIAAALHAHPAAAQQLVELFSTAFDPHREFTDLAARASAVQQLVDEIDTELDSVDNLDHDQIIRRCRDVVVSIVRTNAFQPDHEALTIKISTSDLAFLPLPRPLFETFVCSPRVTGTHLRCGRIARGGIRWSDRIEDFRTEVLGLVKAQEVKNTVIVPDGAKGGFVPLQLPHPAEGRAAIAAEAIQAYKIFIASLLSITDNSLDGRTVEPSLTVVWDEPDPYLVVAPDKGTATFSDYANEISVNRGYWLHDAFASGGKTGFDHKALGITARGAWESATQHCAALGLDLQRDSFTIVGIGDMSGDVFGNGMLQSEHGLLMAAFNHQHIFLDPHPDPILSYAERRRLFDLPRSTWDDYDRDRVSDGGGVYSRLVKAIPITPQVREVLGIADPVSSMTPNELISAILQAPVDILFNGGVGTFVRGTTETNRDVSDRANDAIRVTGSQVRSRCAVEGGNLGWTQRGRIEYAQNSGRINTDFIDNSGGVDTSDSEVNIKVLLRPAVRDGRLTVEARNEVIGTLSPEVVRHVLHHNRAQNLILTDAQHRSHELAAAHETFMVELEQRGLLDRKQEFLPSTGELAARAERGKGLTRPELSVLLAYAKIMLTAQISASDLPEDPFLSERLFTYFPHPLREPFHDDIAVHPLAREIVTSVTVNRFVDSQGITAFHRLQAETGAEVGDIVRAQIAARALTDAFLVEKAIGESTLSDGGKTRARVGYRRGVERTTRVLLYGRPAPFNVTHTVAELSSHVNTIRAILADIIPADLREQPAEMPTLLEEAGLPPAQAQALFVAPVVHLATHIAMIPRGTHDACFAARVFMELMERLHADKLYRHVDALPRTGRWDTEARAAQRDDLLTILKQVCADILHTATAGTAPEVVNEWMSRVPLAMPTARLMEDLTGSDADLAQVTVGLRQLRQLAQADAV